MHLVEADVQSTHHQPDGEVAESPLRKRGLERFGGQSILGDQRMAEGRQSGHSPAYSCSSAQCWCQTRLSMTRP